MSCHPIKLEAWKCAVCGKVYTLDSRILRDRQERGQAGYTDEPYSRAKYCCDPLVHLPPLYSPPMKILEIPID